MVPSLVRVGVRSALLAAAALAPPAPLAGQLVTPKTVPVHQSGQFDVFPATRAGMAGVAIALDDSLADPFVNPAKAARLRGGVAFGSPFVHGISDGRGGGITLPLGALVSSGRWAGGGVVALQQLDRAGPVWNRPTSERTAVNRYVSGLLARRLDDGLAVGASAYAAQLGAIDGVDLLYGGSERIDQDGSALDLRLGATKELARGGVAELVLLHNRTSMVHDVRFPAQFQWTPTGGQRLLAPARTEHNADRTHVWGAHAETLRPVGSAGWRVGALATANRLSHPKIPNYVLMNIPRDPGTTYAFNLGVGAARTGDAADGATIGVDLIYEPIASETWADAAADTAIAGGGVIPAGGRTVENTFRFSNLKLRLGLAKERPLTAERPSAWGYQLGLAVHAIDYRLRQTNHVERTSRTQDERWMEWTPSLALRYRSRTFTLAYDFRLTCGTGDCVDLGNGDFVTGVPSAGGGIIVAPSAPLRFESGGMSVHRFSFTVPLN